MSSEDHSASFPKDFEKTTQVLPFTKYGISTFEEFQSEERDLEHVEWLRNAGLTSEEIKLYQGNEAGLVDTQRKLDPSVLSSKLEVIYEKINNFKQKAEESTKLEQPSTSSKPESIVDRLQKAPVNFYPPEHPLNNLQEIESGLFGHLKDPIMFINQRRKILRRLERRKERILNQKLTFIPKSAIPTSNPQPGSLWDVRDIQKDCSQKSMHTIKSKTIGPKKQTMYTIKDGKIVRLEPVASSNSKHYNTIDIRLPTNKAEEKLLEGTKMCIDDIKKIERFKDYEPGIPSKVLYIKNIAPSVSQEQLSLLFNQFLLDNGGPIDVALLAGRMRGQAFVSFRNEEVAMQALAEVNGTILAGRPVILQFSRRNRVQDDDI